MPLGRFCPCVFENLCITFLVFFFYLFLFYMKLQQPMYSLEWEAFFFTSALLITIFLFTKESFLKKLSLFFILVFFDGILEIVICSLYWKGICEKLFGLHYTPYINVPNQKVSTILIFFLPAALAEIAFNFLFPLLWKRYIRLFISQRLWKWFCFLYYVQMDFLSFYLNYSEWPAGFSCFLFYLF